MTDPNSPGELRQLSYIELQDLLSSSDNRTELHRLVQAEIDKRDFDAGRAGRKLNSTTATAKARERDAANREAANAVLVEFLKEWAALLLLTALIILWREWPLFPSTAVGWFYVFSMSLAMSFTMATVDTFFGPYKLFTQLRTFQDIAIRVIYGAVLLMAIALVDSSFDKAYPDLKTAHFHKF